MSLGTQWSASRSVHTNIVMNTTRLEASLAGDANPGEFLLQEVSGLGSLFQSSL